MKMNEYVKEATEYYIKNATNTRQLAKVAYELGLRFGRGDISLQERDEIFSMLEEKWEEIETQNKE